jgi:hypothetical protein
MEIQIGKRYRHYKGNIYKVIALALHSETLERVVVYQGEYEDAELGKDPVFVRPYEMFCEEVEVEGKRIPRFELLPDTGSTL